MFDPDRDLFDDETWRDPTDDGERAIFYVLALIGFFLGIALIVAGFVEMSRPGATGTHNLESSNVARFMFWGFGALLVLGPSWLFWHESKHWKLKTLTFERFVSGLLLATVAVVSLFVIMAGQQPMMAAFLPQVALIVAGGMVLTYVFGFAGAYFNVVFPNVARHSGVFVVDKFVAEDTNAKDAMFDVDDDPVRSRYVVLRIQEVGEKRYRVLAPIFEVLEPGTVGKVKIVNGVIREFEVQRRPGR